MDTRKFFKFINAIYNGYYRNINALCNGRLDIETTDYYFVPYTDGDEDVPIVDCYGDIDSYGCYDDETNS